MEVMNTFKEKCHPDKEENICSLVKVRVNLSGCWGHLLTERKTIRKD